MSVLGEETLHALSLRSSCKQVRGRSRRSIKLTSPSQATGGQPVGNLDGEREAVAVA